MKKYFFLISLIVIVVSCTNKQPLFKELSASRTGIDFNNQIVETSDLNILNYEYLYNGGGVGIGDFNNDSLPDIYLTGNLVSNKLYLNKGNLKFEDVTTIADVGGKGKWCKGVSVVDINNDGWQDIYVCAAILPDSNARRNLLYINQGLNDQKIPVFKEMAAEYGLDDPSNTHMAAFFDYDNDGDLDVYLLINDLDGTYPNEFRPIRKDGSWPNTDKLLQNNYDSTKKHAVFTDVSSKAGILIEGHGLGVNIVDINNDGWKDIYVSNDYLSNNILYINNKNGTFTDKAYEWLKHTSKNAMGNDIADINNDGLADIIETDMSPADQYRLKMMNSDISYQTFQNSARYGYIAQYPRNTLQLNRGLITRENDSIPSPVFSEIAYLAGVAHTDWSWAPLLTDVDNDGYRDLLISNGLPKDMSDLDFMAYRQHAVASASLEEILNQLPKVQIPNYVFKNNGDLSFTNKSTEWGFTTPTFSAGMAYADFDRDGDMDLVINNTNMPVSFLENTSEKQKDKNNFIQLRLEGSSQNKDALGTIVKLYTGSTQQVWEHTPYRGYMSTVDQTIHFGIGNASIIDSINIIWPDHTIQQLKNIPANQFLNISYQKNNPSTLRQAQGDALPLTPYPLYPLFTDITKQTGVNAVYRELDFIDFNIQRLIPHKLTQTGPALATADLNGDGYADFLMGGGSPESAIIFFQLGNGTFISKKITDSKSAQLQDDADICLLDIDGDKDIDIYIASGGAENEPQSAAYQDHIYLNDGKGNFKEAVDVLPVNKDSKSCVRSNDIDGDGDLDLFIGARVIPGKYPLPLTSRIYRNDTKNGIIHFTDITKEVAPDLENIGMVTDAVFADINNDKQNDLILTLEWGAITILEKKGNKFVKINTSLASEKGWWTSIKAVDIDKDGDLDLIAGNYGRNGFLNPSEKTPLHIYAKDFDANGSMDAITTSFYPPGIGEVPKEFPVAGRDEFIREMTAMKERFPNYASYAKASFPEIFSAEKMKDALILSANNFNSCWIENKGNNEFVFHPLPTLTQLAPVYGILCDDYNKDGKLDILLNGNEYGMAPYLGRYDATCGLVLLGDGKGNFNPLSLPHSGFYIPGNGRSLLQINQPNKKWIIAGQNAGTLKIFSTHE